MFDAIATHTCIAYSALHDEFQRAFRFVVERVLKHQPSHLFDIGSGTGLPLIPILDSFPNISAISVDASNPMLAVMNQKLATKNLAHRVTAITVPVQHADLVANAESAWGSRIKAQIITSCYTLHHFDPVEKLKIYSNIANALEVDGAFINGDLFSESDRRLASFMQSEEERFLETAVEQHWKSLQGPELTGRDSRAVINDWIAHLRNANKPLPINSYLENSQESTEERLLMQAGFRSIITTFKQGQSAVVIALK